MKKIDFKQLLKKFKPAKRREFKTISSKAHHDWKTMVISFFFLWVLIVLASFYMLIKINGGEIFQVTKQQDELPTMLNKKLIDETAKLFENKKNKLESLKTNRPNISDPSL